MVLRPKGTSHNEQHAHQGTHCRDYGEQCLPRPQSCFPRFLTVQQLFVLKTPDSPRQQGCHATPLSMSIQGAHCLRIEMLQARMSSPQQMGHCSAQDDKVNTAPAFLSFAVSVKNNASERTCFQRLNCCPTLLQNGARQSTTVHWELCQTKRLINPRLLHATKVEFVKLSAHRNGWKKRRG